MRLLSLDWTSHLSSSLLSYSELRSWRADGAPLQTWHAVTSRWGWQMCCYGLTVAHATLSCLSDRKYSTQTLMSFIEFEFVFSRVWSGGIWHTPYSSKSEVKKYFIRITCSASDFFFFSPILFFHLSLIGLSVKVWFSQKCIRMSFHDFNFVDLCAIYTFLYNWCIPLLLLAMLQWYNTIIIYSKSTWIL